MKPASFRSVTARPSYYLLLMSLALMLNYMDRSVVAVLVVPLKAELHLSDTALGLLTGFAFVLIYAVLGLPLARVADRTRRHSMVGIGILIWSVATLASGFASSVAGLVVARMGVGAGEAAGTAPSLSLVSDQYPKARRALVLGVVNAGGALGTALGLALGGLAAEHFGWRGAFLCVGAPGLFLGTLVLCTLDDKPRMIESRPIPQEALPSLATTARFVLGQRSIMLTLAGSLFTGAMLTIITGWSPTFFVRIHHLTLGRVGVTLGLIKGVTGIFGALLGGLVTSHMAKRSDRWQPLCPAIACFATAPAYLFFIITPSVPYAFAALGVGAFFVSSALGPVFSIYQCTSLPRIRSQVVSLHILIASLGIGGGPLLIGFLNDHLLATRGTGALQSSLLIVPAIGICAGLCYAGAALFIERDVERAGAVPRSKE